VADDDLLELARRALDGNAASLVRLVAALVAREEGSRTTVKVEVPKFNYTLRLQAIGPRGDMGRALVYFDSRASWHPRPFRVSGVSILSDIRIEEVELFH
jgi:hypothetical protein